MSITACAVVFSRQGTGRVNAILAISGCRTVPTANVSIASIFKKIVSLVVGCVALAQLAERRSLAGELSHAFGLQSTGDHYVGKPSGTGQRSQPFILPGSINE